MKKLAIFDFDGTLFNTVDDVIICFNEALTINKFPTLTYEEYIERLGGNIDEITSLILKDKNTAENIELIKKTYGELYSTSTKENSLPFPQMHDILHALQDKGILIAINSNRTTDSIKYFVEKHFSDVTFSSIEGHNPAYPSKPHPCGVKRMRKKLNVSKDESIYIGDSITDIKTAKNAKIDCLIVRWGYGNQNAYEDAYPLEIIDEPSQILKYF